MLFFLRVVSPFVRTFVDAFSIGFTTVPVQFGNLGSDDFWVVLSLFCYRCAFRYSMVFLGFSVVFLGFSMVFLGFSVGTWELGLVWGIVLCFSMILS